MEHVLENQAGCRRNVSNNPTSMLLNSQLNNWFEQVWVINLKQRKERLNRFRSDLERVRWPFREPQVFDAIDGDKVGVPKFWQTGGGSYGCIRSHLNILERAIQDDVDTILMLEDDAVFSTTFARDVAAFLKKVPNDWECLMLGGQFVNSKPVRVRPGIVRPSGGGGIQRTHCYGLRGRDAMKALYRTWANAAVHCDWVMGPCMAQFRTYAPWPFLVGQAEGKSDISGQKNPIKFWRSPSGSEPVVVLQAPRPVMEALRAKGWHSGYARDPVSGIDTGLRDLFASGNFLTPAFNKGLKDWIDRIQAEVAGMDGRAICTIWHPKASAALIRPAIRGSVITIAANSVEEAIEQLPRDLDNVPAQSSQPADDRFSVIILRTPRAVMECLQNKGWHSGFWKDEITGQDNGVRRLMALTEDKTERTLGLRRIALMLHEEAQRIPDGIATFWHDQITREMLEADDIRVFEITASTTDEAVKKLNQLKKKQT